MEEMETVEKDLESVTMEEGVDTPTDVKEHEEEAKSVLNPPSPATSRKLENDQRNTDSSQSEQEERPDYIYHPSNTELDAAVETKPDDNTRQDSSALDLITESSFPSIIPKMKKTQKKTLSELHEQLLKKLNPDLIPPVSASLSDIFKTRASDDCSKEQQRESETETHDLRCGDPKSPTPREASNGSVRNPDGGAAAVRRIEKGLYRCSVVDCKCSFNRLNDLKMHVDAEHPHLNSYPCSFCFNEFKELDSMTEHVTAHVKNVFKCSHCQMSSDAKDELLGHISAEHPDLPKKITIYVKILNNDRQKRAALISKSANASVQLNQNTSLLSSNRSEGAVIADKICANGVASSAESSALAGISDKKALNNEVTKSRSSRKSSRPIKWQRDLADDIVRIFSAEKSTTIPCDRCSFTCSSQLHLNAHRFDGHVGQNVLALKCKICRFSTDVKMSFQNHMVHHKGRHVIRYYICPYCSTDTNSMDVVEEHILDKHPTEAFRFEVLQETVEFLQDLFKCPVCRGMFLWKDEFIDHVRSVHYLDELAEYLLENFPGAFPPNGFVPKSLFLNLLPETIDFEEQPVEQMVVSSDEENSGITAVDERKDMESLNEETSICVQPSSTRDKEKVFQFNCHTCSYTSCDYDRYMAHFKTHDSEKPDSLIKKLLTKPGVPPYTSGQSSDLELDVDTFRTSPSLFSGRKTGGMFHCHLCPFTCTKTVHFKRHLAIHTRNEMLKEGYKCGYCQFAHYRLNCVKFHLGKYHGDFPNKMIRIMDGIEIELGVNDDPGKVKSHSIQPSSSGPLLRTANEKRPTIRYGVAKMASEVRRPPECRGGSCSVSGLSSQEMSLSEFELQLPGSMIYPEAVKCPKCDFTNRVRINLIRHLKLHREEAEMNEDPTYAATLSTLSKESSELRALMMKDVPHPSAPNASKHEDSSASNTAASKRNLILDEKPLLRSILCEKPVAPKLERESVESDYSDSDSNSENHDLRTISRSKTPIVDYSGYAVRLRGSDVYQCKDCSFVHRFPSKVKRHFNYKHTTLMPYRCGHCSFKAAESGRVKRHCHQVHRSRPVHILKAEESAVKRDDSGNIVGGHGSETDDDVMIVDETISGDSGDGHGERWLSQFVITIDSNLRCCKLCGYQQEEAMSLQHHVYTKHLKLYPFSCKYCGVALTEIDRVKRHIEKHHSGMPLVVVRRHFEDSPPPGGAIQATAADDKKLTRISVKQELLENDEEAPQLDFYPKSDNFGAFPDSSGWNDEDGADSNTENDDIMSTYFDESLISSSRDQHKETEDFESFSGAGSHRRLFKCVYCGIISKWNRRDIRLHIMHVHLKRRVYTCRHCSFGNSKSKAVVKSHCAKFHPTKPVSVRDDIALFNAVIPIEDKSGVVTMAFSSLNGVPVLDIDELESILSKKVSAKPETQQRPPVLEPNCRIKTEVDHESESRGERKSRPFVSTRDAEEDGIPLNLTSVRLHSAGSSQEKKPRHDRPTPVSTKAEPAAVRQRTEWRCKLCSFVNQNASHVKYHLICYHLKLKPFSCPYCRLYIWKSQGVMKHIEKLHPGKEKKACATVEEKATYISENIEKVVPPGGATSAPKEDAAPVEPKSVAGTSTIDSSASSQQTIGYFRCDICGYQDARNDKTKYHVIKQHLKLRQFSCPHCHLYMWGRQQVAKHIEEEHPGMEISITRTFQEYEDFLKQIITKVTDQTSEASSAEDETDAGSEFHKTPISSSPAPPLPPPPPLPLPFLSLRCNRCSFVTDSELSLSAHKRSHRMFQCFHCEFRHMLAAKVQIHCLAKHPNKLVKYRQCDSSASPSPSSVNSLGDHCSAPERKGAARVFHPCDECPAHFDTASELEKHVQRDHDKGLYVCNYCHIVMWSRAGIDEHLQQTHPEKRPNFKHVKKEPNESGKQRPSSDSSKEDELPSQNLDNPKDGAFQMSNKKSSIFADQTHCGTTGDAFASYRCRLCNYHSGKVTVMRHHTMSHLRYHPYLCPYCDVVRSVKSFPITKHVRSKHPNCEPKFLYARDEELEAQVKNSYYRVQPQSNSSSTREETSKALLVEDSNCERKVVASEVVLACRPASESSFPAVVSSMLPRKVLYRCTFCSLKTHIRTDMRHHLMREIQYKPFRCMFCTYTEPCKWSMRKHFRTKHGGAEVEVEEIRDSESDAQVEKLLEKCTVLLKCTTDPELLAWKPSVTPQRRVYGVAHVPPSKPPSCSSSSSSALNPKPMFGTSLYRRPFKSMAIKFHRCPHCTYTNTNLKLVRGHMVKHGPFRLQCGYCDYRGHYPSRIRKHLRRHHPTMPFKCTKVALPPKDQKPEEIPVIHVPRVAVKTQNKPAPGTVFLDGVPVDIPLIPDGCGWYRCLQCDYQSVNREHFKMHVVIHRPPKWKCFYCDQKYSVIFRLRRHSNSKHPNLPIKWVDVQTGHVSMGSLKPNSTVSRFGPNIHERPRSTARKSTSKAARLRVIANFTAHQQQTVEGGSESSGLDSDLTIVDETPFVISEPYSLVTNDSESEMDFSVDLDPRSDVINLCCHLCLFTTVDRFDFVSHLADIHANVSDSVSIEVLSGVEDDEAFALRRCGFCRYETFAGQEFNAHVRTHTVEGPTQCGRCSFASFMRKTVVDHIESEHPGLEVQLRPLKDQYTMSTRQSPLNGLDAIVMLEDLMKLSDLEFQSVISAHRVSFERHLL